MLKFIDLFAGIGGFRLGFERAGCSCTFSSEWDKYAQITYKANHGDTPHGDITKIAAEDIPAHDIIAAGFPCQSFSSGGAATYNHYGYASGFNHPTKGTLFFEIARILQHHKPKVFILENVKNLKSHDKGNTFKTIIHTLEEELGYTVFHKIIDAKTLVPQHRERIYIIGFRDAVSFQFPVIPDGEPKLRDILEEEIEDKYTLSDKTWLWLQRHKEKHALLGNGFGYSIADLNSYTRTLSARYGGDGSEILISQIGKNPRKLTPRECSRLMGYPDSFHLPCSNAQSYKQLGNSVVVPVVELLAKEMVKYL